MRKVPVRDLKKCVGKLAVVTFLDHVKGDSPPVKCRVVGWLRTAKRKYVVLKWWKAPGRHNQEFASILRNTILKVKVEGD